MENESTDKYGCLKRFKISPEAFTDLLKENDSLVEVTDGLPDDAEFVRLIEDEKNGCFWFYIASKEYDYIPEAGIVPDGKDVEFKSYLKDEVLE